MAILGIVKNGVVIIESGATLPDGTRVEIHVVGDPLPPQLADEFAAWDQLGNEAWLMIDEWEREDG